MPNTSPFSSNASHQAAAQMVRYTLVYRASAAMLTMIWYGLLALLAGVHRGVAPSYFVFHTRRRYVRKEAGEVYSAPLMASSVLILVSRVGEIQSLGGLLVGGAVGIWFFVAGVVWLSILFHLPRPRVRAVGLGVALFMLLWVAFGAMAQIVWLQWWLPALQLWPLISLACFLVSSIGVATRSRSERFCGGWDKVHGGRLFLTLQFLPQLGFIFLLLPLFPYSWRFSPLLPLCSMTCGLCPWQPCSSFGWSALGGFSLT